MVNSSATKVSIPTQLVEQERISLPLTWDKFHSYGGRADFTDAASFSIIAREKTQLDWAIAPKPVS